MAKKRHLFTCRSCDKVTSTTNSAVFGRRLCFKCRSFREFDDIAKEMMT